MTNSGSLLILHLSDLHVVDGSLATSRIVEAGKGVASLWSEGCSLVVVLSGDIAFSGKSEQYDHCSRALDELETFLRGEGFSEIRIVAVPGNHDCDFSRFADGVHDALLLGLESQGKAQFGVVGELIKSQSEFEVFRGVVCSEDVRVNDLVRVVEFSCSSGLVRLVLVNTAWSSKLKEKPGVLRMPESLLPDLDHSDALSIAVLHHPMNWFTPEDGKCLSEWLDRYVDVALWGHEHRDDDFTVTRRGFGSTVRHMLAMPVTDHSSECGFSCIRIHEGHLETHAFAWRDGRLVPGSSSNEPIPVNAARSIGRVRFTAEFNEFMRDAGAAFRHPRLNRQLLLSDIFVPAEFRTFQAAKSSAQNSIGALQQSAFFDELFSGTKTIVSGAEQSGKTVLARCVIEEARHRGVTPVYLDGVSLKSSNRGEVTSWISRSLSQQFENDCLGQVQLCSRSEKLVIIDGLDKLPAGNQGAAIVLDRVSQLATRVLLITSQHPTIAMVASGVDAGHELPVWKGGEWFELLPMGHKRRGDLIRRWVQIGHENSADSDAVEAEVRQVKSVLDASLGKNFAPRYPLFLLMFLQQIETYRDNKTAISNGSHGHLFEALITQSINRCVSVHTINVVHDFLAFVAYQLWRRNETSISAVGLSGIVREFRAQVLVAINAEALLPQLALAGVIRPGGEGFEFRYAYLHYFYLAKWLLGSGEKYPEDAAAVMDQLVRFIHTERSANVMMFLAHFGKERWVLSYLRPIAKLLFSDVEPVVFAERSALASKFNDRKSQQILFSGDAARISDAHHEVQDEIDNHSAQDGGDEQVEDALKFNTAMRIVQVLGQVIRARAGGVLAQEKVEVVGEAIALSRRLTTKIYDIIEESADSLVRATSDVVEKNLALRKDEAAKLANRILAAIVSGVAKFMISKVADSFSAPDLLPLLDELGSSSGRDHDFELYLLVSRVSVEPAYPGEAVEDFISGLKDSDILTHAVVAWAVSRQFYLQPPPRGIRDRACARLGIEVKPMHRFGKEG